MKRALMLSLILGGCGIPLHIQAVHGGGVSADGDTAWFGVVEARGDTHELKVYHCTPDGCGEVEVSEEGPPPRRPYTPTGSRNGDQEPLDPVDEVI